MLVPAMVAGCPVAGMTVRCGGRLAVGRGRTVVNQPRSQNQYSEPDAQDGAEGASPSLEAMHTCEL
jgi:hypothetical protein